MAEGGGSGTFTPTGRLRRGNAPRGLVSNRTTGSGRVLR